MFVSGKPVGEPKEYDIDGNLIERNEKGKPKKKHFAGIIDLITKGV